MIIMIVGSTGAGKTTYARNLSSTLPGVVYSIDNWMKSLYGADMPTDPPPEWYQENHQWYVERIDRCENLIRELTLARAKLGQKSILDLGFSTVSHRRLFIQFFQTHNIGTEIHFLDVPLTERWRRVQQRNSEQGQTYVMTVDQSMFNFMEGIFEPPSASEGVTVRKV